MTRSARLAWTALALEAVLLLAAAVMGLAAGPAEPTVGASWGSRATAVLIPVSLLAYPLVGGLIAGRRGNPIGWLLLASGLAWSLIFALDAFTALSHEGTDGAPSPIVLWTGSPGWWVPAVGLTATIMLQLFPDGRLVSPRWRRLALLSGATILVVFVLVTVEPTLGTDAAPTPNPYDVAVLRPLARVLSPLFVLFPVCIVASVASVVVRYRRAGAEERRQIKWLAFAGAGVAVVYAVTVAATFATEAPEGVPLAVAVLQDLTLLSFAAIPAAVGVAVLRYRLYDIDRIISRTLTYALVTGVLLAAYFGLVLGLGGVARLLTGSTDLAVAASTLVVAAMFRPVLRRVRSRIDHRFNRARYDAAQTIEAFTARLRDEIDIDALGAELRDLVGRTMQPSSVSLRLRGDR